MNEDLVKKGKENNRLKTCIAGLILLLIALLSCCGYGIYKNFQNQSKFADDFSAKKGLLSDMSKDQIQKLMDQTVKEGYVNVFINSNPIFENGKAPGNIYIQNVPANKFGYRVTIKLKDSNEEILHTGYIAPGYNVEKHTLDRPLAKGQYEAVAVFLCYKDEKDKKPIAESDVNIRLTVLK